MTRKKTIKDFTSDDLVHDLAYRLADQHYRAGMTMTEMERCVNRAFGSGSYAGPAIAMLLSRMPLEKPTAKLCPKCNKRTPVKAKDRERTLRSLCGPVTLKRNYHYCEACQYGFYPVDRLLELPQDGELTAEMEKRALDFAINDVYGECASRWSLHYERPLSDNLFRRVIDRVGGQCEAADQGLLQEALKPKSESAAEVLVVEVDGSMLPIRGAEPWKEAKVGVTYRHDLDTHAPVAGSGRYVAIVNGLGEFAPIFEEALLAESLDEVRTVIWLGDGAPCNWTLADQLAPDAVQILDWYHATEHAVACGRLLLGEESPWLPLWQRRAETLLAEGNPEALIAELMDCVPDIKKRRREKVDALKAVDDLVRYYRTNAHRMKYRLFREHGFPIGSGAIESAHRHVLQVRMKRAGQRWAMPNAKRMARLRAAYRTAGPARFHAAIRRAHWDSLKPRDRSGERRNGFRYARQGVRDMNRVRSN